MENLTIYAPILGIIGLLVAGVLYAYVVKQPVGTAKMRELADAIHDGAMAFLKREYRILAIFVVVVFALLFVFLNRQTAYAFLGGATCSVLAGYFGMMAATKANVRTSAAANQSGQAKALSVAFSGGAVMGMSVAALGLIGVGILFYLFGGDPESAKYINGFAMGPVPLPCLPGSVVEFIPRLPMLELTWLVKLKPGFLRMIPVIRQPLLTMLVTMLVI